MVVRPESLPPEKPTLDFDAFVDRLYILAEQQNHYTGHLYGYLDDGLTWFVLKQAITELLADQWIAWTQRAAEGTEHAG